MIGVDEEDDIGFANLLAQGRSVLRSRGCIDDGGCDILRGADAWRDGDLGKNRLNLAGDELVLDESGNEGGFAGALVTADADADCGIGVSGRGSVSWGKVYEPVVILAGC